MRLLLAACAACALHAAAGGTPTTAATAAAAACDAALARGAWDEILIACAVVCASDGDGGDGDDSASRPPPPSSHAARERCEKILAEARARVCGDAPALPRRVPAIESLFAFPRPNLICCVFAWFAWLLASTPDAARPSLRPRSARRTSGPATWAPPSATS